MTRLAIGAAVGIVVGVLVGAALSIRADQEPSEETVAAAVAAGVDPVELEGALNSLHDAGLAADATTYLASIKAIPGGAAHHGAAVDGAGGPNSPASTGHLVRVRLTEYLEYGVTYGGGYPYLGSTACSWNFALGTRFRLPDGEVFVCNDRGLLGSAGWLDLWRAPATVRKYAPYALVEVLP